jgi:hypothetical protein
MKKIKFYVIKIFLLLIIPHISTAQEILNNYPLAVGNKWIYEITSVINPREVATLANKEKPAGSYEVEFDGNSLSSGIYFYKLQAGDYIEVKKMIFLK